MKTSYLIYFKLTKKVFHIEFTLSARDLIALSYSLCYLIIGDKQFIQDALSIILSKI